MEVSSFNQGAAQSCNSAGIEIFRGVWLRSRSCVSSHLFRSSKHEAPFCFVVRFTDRSFLHVFVSKCVFIPSGSNLSLVEIDWPLVKRSLEDPICFLSCVWCDVFFYPHYLRMWCSHCVIPCTQTWWWFEFVHDRQTDQRTGHFSVRVTCCLLSSQQLYLTLCAFCFGAHEPADVAAACARRLVRARVRVVSPLALAVRVYTRWHPRTYCTICAHSRDTVSSLTLCVYQTDT